MTARSASSLDLPVIAKLRYALQLFRMYWEGRHTERGFEDLFTNFAEYDAALRVHSRTTLKNASVFEIGYGARPYRLQALLSMGIDARGIDLDVPILDGSIAEFWRVQRTNGTERALRSFVRHLVFDRKARDAFRRALSRKGYVRRPNPAKFLVGDAADLQIAPKTLDLVIAEDVFEHIPYRSLDPICRWVSTSLKPQGIALIRPNIFTGITGGHLIEWYAHNVEDVSKVRSTEPWEHLRKRREVANTFLNGLTRSSYRRLFEQSFLILEERTEDPNLGREYLTASIAAELAGYTEDELFSNRVLFILRPLAGGSG